MDWEPVVVVRSWPDLGCPGTPSSDLGMHAQKSKVMTPTSCSSSSHLTEELTCAVCMELFREPVILPCGHSFCRTCIDGTCPGKVRCSCPTCRVTFLRGRHTGVVALASLVERFKCESPVRSLREQCEDHQEKLKLFCKDDGLLACVICRDAPRHMNHSFLPVMDAMEMYKSQLCSAMDPLKSTLKKFQELKNEQEKTLRFHKWETSDTKSSISSLFEKLHQALRDREVEMLDELQTQAEKTQKEMEETLAKLKVDCLRAQSTLEAAENRLKEPDPLEFLEGIHSFMERYSQEQRDCSSAPEPFRSLHQHPSKGPIEYMIWKQLKSVISPAPSQLTLEPETAHQNLIVSGDRTSVRFSGINWWPPHHPKRFVKATAVLGSEGFGSGRHYWEIDVGRASEWVLGVAEETINRKENVPLIPWNGIWALQLKAGNSYEALEKSPRPLSLTVRPQKIGVYLDFEEKLLSFYNADNMSHIHTFFFFTSVKLFPYFCLGLGTSREKFDSLTICH